MTALSPRQLEVVTFIRDHIAEKGYAPTVQEVGDHFGIASRNAVYDHLSALKSKGFVAWDAKKARTLRVLKPLPGSHARSAEGGDAPAATQPTDIISGVRKAIACHRFRFANEKEFQEGIASALASHRIAFEREVQLGPGDIVDFLIGGFAFEVKIDGSLSALTRQLHRYAQHDQVKELVAVSSRIRLINLPLELNGKPVRTIAVAGGIL